MSLKDKLTKLLTPPPDPQPGVTHWRGAGELAGVRLHLRIEDDGKGVLIVNAAKILHLNETAAEMAQLLLREVDVDQAVKALKRRYKAPAAQLRADYLDLREKIMLLAQHDGVCPVTYLGLERVEPFATRGSVPHRMDLALTYRCNNKCGHCYVDRPSDMPSLARAEWLRVIRKTWDLGIAQLIFTGGEATLHEDLPLFIAEAEELGQVTGLITNGRKLAAPTYLDKLIDAGLDHVQITLESHLVNVHDAMVGVPGAFEETCAGIRHAAASGLYLLTNTTLSKQNAVEIERFLDFLVELGVANMAMNGFIHAGKGEAHPDAIPEARLPEILERVRDGAAEREIVFRWYTPTQYCTCNPIDLGLGIKQCTAGRYNMCIEPNGSVIPCQSYFESMGHFLDDEWKTIWNEPRLVELREHTWVDEKCAACHDLEVCGGGCPLYRRLTGDSSNPGAHGC
ncbi:MAG TPA: PqqD family peptide modification chaperone [bacterium]|nr:PqqD family peptide modification chaperone [bacterium]